MESTVRSSLAQDVRRGLFVAAVVLVVAWPRPVAQAVAAATPLIPDHAGSTGVRLADFRGETAGPDARELANWIADTRDNAGLEFVIVDKRRAAVFVFSTGARLLGSSPVLLGAARGDETVPGIGSRPLALVKPHERTTPAGRFIAERGHNARGEDVVWVDYDAAVSMHRVRTTDPKERRLERLATPSVDDNRISYGCINVPVAFYERYIRPAFADRRALVYVLPEVKSLQQVFGSYDVVSAQPLPGTISPQAGADGDVVFAGDVTSRVRSP
jgi:hypothetical protein